jgi:Na+-driven multidrug efflux pump
LRKKEKAMKTLLQKFKKLFNPVDLTQGSIIKGLLVFMVPILLSMVFQQLYTLTDAIIVGQNLGTYEIAGINDVSCLSNIALQFCIGATSGFSVAMSHKIGEKNQTEIRKSFYLQICLCLFLTVVLTISFCLATDGLLELMKIRPSEADPNQQLLYQSAHDYLFIIFLGIFASMAYNFIFANLRALGDSFTPFLFLVLGVILNIGLDILFIVPFQWGVSGSAWATVLSQALAALGCLIYTFIKFKNLHYQHGDLKFNRQTIIEHLRLGLPLGLQSAILQIGIIIMQMGVIAFDYTAEGVLVNGTPAQVGYSVACKVNLIIMNVYQSVATAMMTFLGQNYGCKKKDRIKKGFLYGCLIGFIFYVILTIVGLLITINGAYMYIFLKPDNITPEAIHYGNLYLYLCVPSDLILLILFICRHSLQGLDRPLFPFLAGLGELAARTLCCILLPQLVNGGPVNSMASTASFIAVCLADPLAWVAASGIMIIPLMKTIFGKKNKKHVSLPHETEK